MSNPETLLFELYRYQISPVKRIQLSLFGEEITFEELKEKKNEVFAQMILDNAPKTIVGKGIYLQRGYYQEDNFYMYKFAAKKLITHHTKDLKDEILEDYPFVYVMVNNNPYAQTIAISKNYKAFNSTKIVANILEYHYDGILINHNLSFSLNPILDEKDYWSIIQKYQNRIYQIRFDIIRPNITNLSEALKEGIKELASTTNTHKTRIELNAPQDQILEKIDPENETIKTLSNYSIGGGGEISLKAKGVRGRIKTSKSIRTYEIKSLEINGNVEEVVSTLKNIIEGQSE